MKLTLIIMTTLVLSGCGADGPPVRPSANANVTVSPNGVRVVPSVGVNMGNVSLRVAL